MKVSDLLISIAENSDYVANSLLLKSSDNKGCSYKWLIKAGDIAYRKQIFIALDPEESELELLDKTVINYIEVSPAK